MVELDSDDLSSAGLDVSTVSAAIARARVQELINSYRTHGHLAAHVDPLGRMRRPRAELEIHSHELGLHDLDDEFVVDGFGGTERPMSLRDIVDVLRTAYCGTVGIEYMHIEDAAQRRWIQDRVERPHEQPTHDERLRILAKLNEAEAFEAFLQTKFVGQTRFSLEGAESVIPLLDSIMLKAVGAGLDEVAIAMAHRGRLNVLANIASKAFAEVFHEFRGGPDGDDAVGTGDVKYHLGTEGTFRGAGDTQIRVSVAANPSHLDAVDGVLEGMVRAKQDRRPRATFLTLPIIIHGDAAMAGQGVVGETMQMSQLLGYRTGGTIRININNQVGFTTLPREARSSGYATDIAKTIQAPVFHVNGDDPEAVVRVARLAFDYRQEFHRDVVIDLISYRRRGHNEADDPSMTQPQMYTVIQGRHSVAALYAAALLDSGETTAEEYDLVQRDYRERLDRAFAETPGARAASPTSDPGEATEQAAGSSGRAATTAVDAHTIRRIGDAFGAMPRGFTIHPKLQQLLAKRVEMSREGGIDWAFGELVALGSLLLDGTAVRMSGQDSRRGTFSQRHSVLHDQASGREWLPLAHLSDSQARFWIYDSLLSEYAVTAFEYGYSVARPDALVIWEAQFGDFVNGAQVVVDEFVSSAEQKWGQQSSLVFLLPHGHEGSGPDHSSARIERFLQLCAENNMTVAQPSTPASYFHLLRRQAYARPRRPLIVFTPKSMLRMPHARSTIDEFTAGRFEPVIDDVSAVEKPSVARVLLVAGKLYHELRARLAKEPDPRIALVRVEQYYPVPMADLTRVVERYPAAELVWVQEEPRNQGAWTFLLAEVGSIDGRPLRLIARPASASPATGSFRRHVSEQSELVTRALTLTDAD